MTSSNSSALAWRESTDISRPRVRVCRAREDGEAAEEEEEVDEVEAEVRMEDGARVDGAEVEVTGVVEVTILDLTMMKNLIEFLHLQATSGEMEVTEAASMMAEETEASRGTAATLTWTEEERSRGAGLREEAAGEAGAAVTEVAEAEVEVEAEAGGRVEAGPLCPTS